MAPFDRAIVVSSKLSICDRCAICNHSAAICDRMSPTLKSTGEWVTWAKISLGVDLFGSAESEHPRLTNGKIISEEFQPM